MALPLVALALGLFFFSQPIQGWYNALLRQGREQLFYWLSVVFIIGPIIAGFVLGCVAFYLMSPDIKGGPHPRWASGCALAGAVVNGIIVFFLLFIASYNMH